MSWEGNDVIGGTRCHRRDMMSWEGWNLFVLLHSQDTMLFLCSPKVFIN